MKYFDMEKTLKPKFGKHAEKSMQQQGVRKITVENIWHHADAVTYMGKAQTTLRVSIHHLNSLTDSNAVTPQCAEKMKNRCIVVNNDNNYEEIIAVAYCGDKAGRRYRKNHYDKKTSPD